MKELDKRMYFKASRVTLETAKLLRNNMTNSEKLLWEQLKGKQVMGLRFRRQHPIDIYIADFYCHDARLFVEVDGEIHKEKAEYDDGREAEIERYNIKILRFSNDDVMGNIDEVINKIKVVIKDRI